MSEEKIKKLFENIDRRLILHNAINEPVSGDFDSLIKLSVAYEQLQQENQQLKERLNKYEDPEDLTLMFMYCDEKAKDKIKQLQEQLQQGDEVIEEAIEHILINSKPVYKESISSHIDIYYREMEDVTELLDILNKYKGGNKNV